MTNSRKDSIFLSKLLTTENIFLSLNAKNKEELIKELASKICKYAPEVDYDKLVQDLLKREKECSTGIGYNVAIPHAETNATDHLVLIFARHRGIDFASLDGKPAKLFFVIASPPESRETYRKVLTQLAIMLRVKEIREKLISAKNKKEVLDIIRNYEK
jgi:fructose-specific phosphotransferase system IIA component